MENGPFIDDFPIEPSIYKGFSMAMLNNQMVDATGNGWLDKARLFHCQVWFFCPRKEVNCSNKPIAIPRIWKKRWNIYEHLGHPFLRLLKIPWSIDLDWYLDTLAKLGFCQPTLASRFRIPGDLSGKQFDLDGAQNGSSVHGFWWFASPQWLLSILFSNKNINIIIIVSTIIVYNTEWYFV